MLSILLCHINVISLKKTPNYFSNALGLLLILMLDILCVRFDIMKKRLISSYDEENDTFIGKVDGENGYVANYGISDGVYLGINRSHLPTSVFVSNASEVLDTSKSVLESSDVKIGIDCDGMSVTFMMCIEDLLVFSTRCRNHFGIPSISYHIDSNI